MFSLTPLFHLVRGWHGEGKNLTSEGGAGAWVLSAKMASVESEAVWMRAQMHGRWKLRGPRKHPLKIMLKLRPLSDAFDNLIKLIYLI